MFSYIIRNLFLEPQNGINPLSFPYHRNILSLNYRGLNAGYFRWIPATIMSLLSGSNRRPAALRKHNLFHLCALQSSCSTAELRRQMQVILDGFLQPSITYLFSFSQSITTRNAFAALQAA